MPKTKKNREIVLAVSRDGIPYVRLRDSRIPPLCALVDCLRLAFFGKGKTAYISLETALEWFVNEAKHCPENKCYPQSVEWYRNTIERFKRGEIPCAKG
jgi:hypothetical protein